MGRGRPKKGEKKPVSNRITYGTNRDYILARLDRDARARAGAAGNRTSHPASSFGANGVGCAARSSRDFLPPSPPAEKATARRERRKLKRVWQKAGVVSQNTDTTRWSAPRRERNRRGGPAMRLSGRGRSLRGARYRQRDPRLQHAQISPRRFFARFSRGASRWRSRHLGGGAPLPPLSLILAAKPRLR
jgi:hypothetical protein